MEIIQRTAQKAVESPQLEVMLKLRQSHDNPDFWFLRANHQWHAYYQHLKEKARAKLAPKSTTTTATTITAQKSDQDKSRPTRGENDEKDVGNGGLFDGYASSSEDENDKDKGNDNDKTKAATQEEEEEEKKKKKSEREAAAEAEAAKRARTQAEADERKAKRLKKAKALRGHFALKMMERNGGYS